MAVEGKRRRRGTGEGEEVEGHDEQGSWREEAGEGSGRRACHVVAKEKHDSQQNPFFPPNPRFVRTPTTQATYGQHNFTYAPLCLGKLATHIRSICRGGRGL